MNASKVRSEIEKVIAENRSHMSPKQTRKQYAPGKAQLAKLTGLGILDLMPVGFGFSDADAVIRAASVEKSVIMNAYGEGEEVPASALNEAVSEVTSDVEIAQVNELLNKMLTVPEHNRSYVAGDIHAIMYPLEDAQPEKKSIFQQFNRALSNLVNAESSESEQRFLKAAQQALGLL